jgi:hypothetical protein
MVSTKGSEGTTTILNVCLWLIALSGTATDRERDIPVPKNFSRRRL